MNRFYRKPKPETMKKNRETNKELYSEEMTWCKEHINDLKHNSFIMKMYMILISGSRKMTPKMVETIRKEMKRPIYDPIKKIERKEKIQPILEKIALLVTMIKKIDGERIHTKYSAYGFVKSCEQQALTNLRLTENQMTALNNTFKKYNEKLEKQIKKDK